MKLIFATQNPNKIKEISQQLIGKHELIGLKDLNFQDELAEDHNSLEENSKQKAEFIFRKFKQACFAEDSGLLVNALNGAPGVKSARYAGHQRNDEDNLQLLLQNLNGITNRSAYFKTVISLIINDELMQFTGKCEGVITYQKQGKAGFGYDPIFVPEGYDRTFAEMSLEEKAEISHRGKAVLKLIAYLNSKSR